MSLSYSCSVCCIFWSLPAGCFPVFVGPDKSPGSLSRLIAAAVSSVKRFYAKSSVKRFVADVPILYLKLGSC